MEVRTVSCKGVRQTQSPDHLSVDCLGLDGAGWFGEISVRMAEHLLQMSPVFAYGFGRDQVADCMVGVFALWPIRGVILRLNPSCLILYKCRCFVNCFVIARLPSPSFKSIRGS